jgi:Kdo2-lipid IVA lauroyltransferase/acyltransferase
MRTLFIILSKMPLVVLHVLGAMMGWLVFLASPTYRKRLLDHAKNAGLSRADALASVAQAGCMMAEIPRLWMGKPLPYQWHGDELAVQAYAAGKGVIYLSPHLGCFEILAQAWALRFSAMHGPFTALFRPSRKAWMADLVANSRNRPGLVTVPTTPAGVRQLIKALRHDQGVGLLPDQVPPEGQGLWVPFFGRPAYTMTLAVRLAQQTGATILVGWGERLPWGRGFVLHVEPLITEGIQNTLSDDVQAACLQVNQAMERVILKQRTQYLWGYGRYKQPRSTAL